MIAIVVSRLVILRSMRRGGTTLRPAFGTGPVTGGAEQRAALQALLSAPFRLPPQRRS